MVSHDMANIVHQGGKILQMRQKPLFWGTMKEYVKSEIAHSFLGREELATLGHRCGGMESERCRSRKWVRKLILKRNSI